MVVYTVNTETTDTTTLTFPTFNRNIRKAQDNILLLYKQRMGFTA